jgi:hypothetical protein
MKKPFHTLVLGTVLVVGLSGSASRACGYHNDVSIARGALNWTYPDALHVIGAISAATVAKRLSPPEGPAPDPFGARYRATVRALERFAELLGGGPDETPPPSFSLVLVEPMLWAHFEAGPDRLRVQTHVAGPQPDQLVLVSGQDVISAIANEALDIGEAQVLGLIRLYGTQPQTARFRAAAVLRNQALRIRDRASGSESTQ